MAREQCERCKDWERMGLSAFCPSCDQTHYEREAAWREEWQNEQSARDVNEAYARGDEIPGVTR